MRVTLCITYTVSPPRTEFSGVCHKCIVYKRCQLFLITRLPNEFQDKIYPRPRNQVVRIFNAVIDSGRRAEAELSGILYQSQGEKKLLKRARMKVLSGEDDRLHQKLLHAVDFIPPRPPEFSRPTGFLQAPKGLVVSLPSPRVRPSRTVVLCTDSVAAVS